MSGRKLMYLLMSKKYCSLYRLIGALLSIAMLSSSPTAGAEEEAPITIFPDTVPDFISDAMRYLSLDESGKEDLLAGKVLFSGMPDMEVLDEQLAVAGVMLIINRPMHEIVDLVLQGDTFRDNDKLIDFGLVSEELSADGVTLSTFRNVHFTKLEKKEVNKLLRVSAGTEYNLSNVELARFRGLDTKADSAVEDVSALFRDILLQRTQSYMQHGLQGIAGYQRKKSEMSPSEELTVATDTSWFMKKHFPEFHRTIVSFPDGTTEGTHNRFYWMKQSVDERPHLALTHHTINISEDYAIGLDVHYYTSHSYNAIHTLVLLVPLNDDTLVLSSNRTFTDKVLGFASNTKRRIGRRIVAKLMAEKFIRLKQMLE
jgi:hypothetical protein